MKNLTFIYHHMETTVAIDSVVVCLQVLGILLNLAFIRITKKDTKKPADFTLIYISSVQIGLSVVTFGQVAFVVLYKDRHIDLHWHVFFDALYFWCKGLYIWLSVYLITARFKVIKNIETVPSGLQRVRKPNYYQITIVVVLSVAVVVRSVVAILDIPGVPRQLAFRYSSIAFLTIPWAIFCSLNTILIVKTIIFAYKWNVSKRVRSYSLTESNQQDSVTAKLVKQVVYSLFFHTGFMMIPYAFLIVIDTLSWTEIANEKMLGYLEQPRLILQAMLSLLNPLSLGILLKQHRQVLASFLGIKKLSQIISSTRVYPAVVMNNTLHTIPELSSTDQVISLEPKSLTRLSTFHRNDISISRNNLYKLSPAHADPMFFCPSENNPETVVMVDIKSVNEEREMLSRRGTGFSTLSVLSRKSRDRLSVRSFTSSAFDGTSLNSSRSRHFNSVSSGPFHKPSSLEHSISIVSNASSDSAIQDTILYF